MYATAKSSSNHTCNLDKTFYRLGAHTSADNSVLHALKHACNCNCVWVLCLLPKGFSKVTPGQQHSVCWLHVTTSYHGEQMSLALTPASSCLTHSKCLPSLTMACRLSFRETAAVLQPRLSLVKPRLSNSPCTLNPSISTTANISTGHQQRTAAQELLESVVTLIELLGLSDSNNSTQTLQSDTPL